MPTILHLPAVAVSIVLGLGFTAACNAQAQIYSDAATRLHDIQAATPCTSQSQPGDDCWRWVTGTALETGFITTISTSSTGQVSSACHVVLQWASGRQEGQIRTSDGDCSKQFGATVDPLPASIELVRGDAVQAKIGNWNYRTDRWLPGGDSIGRLALVARLAAWLWLAWPILHVALAIVFRLRLPRPAPISTEPPPAPALGTTA